MCGVWIPTYEAKERKNTEESVREKRKYNGQQIMVGIIGRKREIIIIHFNDKGKEEDEVSEVGGEGRGRRVGMIGFLFFFFCNWIKTLLTYSAVSVRV